MASGLSAAQISTITTTLSPARLGTFHAAPGFTPGADVAEKYSWHALTSGAFFVSLHMCEVAVRNGVDAALTATYGPDWPWQAVFENSLPNPAGPHFKPQSELRRARMQFAAGATGKVIAELKFAFWCHLFTRRYQNRLWDSHIKNAFPNLPPAYTPLQARAAIQRQLDPLRGFRNRIAHHEPILTEPLADRKLSIESLITWRCPDVANWHTSWEIISQNMLIKP
ncbi:hypothetical protein [Collimonas fungivorans]|uniref:hypothetical protein n=1 Tax=Collimonas fungivorans TaxID=158899 RepID=UPI003FA3D0C0